MGTENITGSFATQHSYPCTAAEWNDFQSAQPDLAELASNPDRHKLLLERLVNSRISQVEAGPGLPPSADSPQVRLDACIDLLRLLECLSPAELQLKLREQGCRGLFDE